MNKKLLLIALPAMMALSGCARVNPQPALNNDASVDAIVEDNISHDEIFGASKELKGPAIRKMNVVDPNFDYKLGYQLHFEEGSVVDSNPDDDDVISIRFIAAIKTNYSKIVWSRGFTSSNGQEKLTFSNKSSLAPDYPELESKVVYTSLSNGNEDLMVAGQGDYADYTGFVVYSLTNIPYKQYLKYYLGVILTLTPAEGEPLKSQLNVISVERDSTDSTSSGLRFTLGNDTDGFELFGFVNGKPGEIKADNPTKGSNAASFTSDFKANDNFLVIQKTPTLFKIWDGACVKDSTHFENNPGPIVCKTDGYFTLYLNGSNEIWPTLFHQKTSIFLRGDAGGGWGNNTGDLGIADDYCFVTDPDNKAVLLGVSLTVGEFKISDQNWSHQWGYTQCKNGEDFWSPNSGNSIVIGGASGNFEAGDDGNIKCKVAGTYNIYLTNNWYVSIELAA